MHISVKYISVSIYLLVDLCSEQTLFKFVKGFYYMAENLIQTQMNDNFNQDIFKAFNKIRKKHKQQTNLESNFEEIIKTTGNESISKAFL